MNTVLLSVWQGFRDGFKTLGEDVSTLVNTVLLALVYILGVGITAIIAKIAGKRFLERDIAASNPKTYWNDVEDEHPDLESHFRQF